MRTVLHIICALGLFFGLSQTVSAQQASALIFSEQTFDFGNIREDGGTVSHSFSFKNGGVAPIVVVSATTTCGCTVPTFSRKPVMPSGTGTIEVTYDPMNRPGSFEKRIAVTTSEKGAAPVRLTITGNVLPREKGIDELYPIYIGNGLRAETNFHSFSYVEHGKAIRTGIGLINTSDKTLKIRIFNNSDSKVYKIEPADTQIILKPDERRDITIAGDLPIDSRVYGTVTETLVFEVDGRRSDATVVVTGIAIDNRESRPDNFTPKAELNKSVVKFEQMKHSLPAKTEYFEILNTGEAPLRIRAVEGLEEGTELSVAAGDRIASGERRRVGITVHPPLKDYGPTVERIRLITDDPLRPMRDIKVTMIIED